MQPAEEPGTAKDKEDASKAKHFILQDQNDIKQQTLALHGGEIKKKKERCYSAESTSFCRASVYCGWCFVIACGTCWTFQVSCLVTH